MVALATKAATMQLLLNSKAGRGKTRRGKAEQDEPVSLGRRRQTVFVVVSSRRGEYEEWL